MKSPGRRAVRDAHAGRTIFRSRIVDPKTGRTLETKTYVKPLNGEQRDENGMLLWARNDGGVRAPLRKEKPL
jgi:hypothetical protein